MSDFDLAIPIILKHEGGWCDTPGDPGGETVFGWSMRTILSLGLTPADLGLNISAFTPGCLKGASVEACKKLYKIHFWDKIGCGNIYDQDVATKIFDASINMGIKRGSLLAQKAANACGKSLVVDGSLGSKSYAAINSCTPKTYIAAYAAEMSNFYLDLIAAKPELAKFKKNWLRRAQWGV